MTEEYSEAKQLRTTIQSDEKESRDDVREEVHFNADKDGHWDQHALKRFKDRPRYQTDLVKPVNDAIAENLNKIKYGGTVAPLGSGTEDVAEIYESICRTIHNISKADRIFRNAGQHIVDHGYDAWMVVNDWSSGESFDQDILIKAIPNSIDRVWLEGVAAASCHSDIRRGFVDTALPRENYDQQFPEGSGISLGSETDYKRYPEVGNTIIVADFYYIKTQDVTLHLLSDNRVVEEEQYRPVADELSVKGVRIVRSKKRTINRCYMRKMDGGGWLGEEKETPFNCVPVFQALANYQNIENRAVYHGNTRKLMDPQRVYDYALSREVADGALAPVDKMAMTPVQAKNHEDQNRKLNSSADPIFLYNPDAKAPPPYRTGGPQVNTQLVNTMATQANNIKEISRSHSPQQGAGLAGHSGRAYEILTEQSDQSADLYKEALTDAIQDTYSAIVDAIPIVYDRKARIQRLTNEDGTTKEISINEEVFDNETQKMVVLNDLSQGEYGFTVTAGPSYSNRQSRTVDAMTQWAALDPSILQDGSDIIYGSMQEPGMKQISERRRKKMVDNGEVPLNQLTDEEKEKITQDIENAKANNQPNPMDQATVAAIMAQVKDLNSQAEERQNKMQLDFMEQQRKMMETMMKAQAQESTIQKTQSETLENLKDATGAAAIVSPAAAKAYSDVAQDMTKNGQNLPTQ